MVQAQTGEFEGRGLQAIGGQTACSSPRLETQLSEAQLRSYAVTARTREEQHTET